MPNCARAPSLRRMSPPCPAGPPRPHPQGPSFWARFKNPQSAASASPGRPWVPMDTPQHPQGTKALPATQTWFPHPVLAGGPHPMCPQIPPSCICQGLRGPPLAGPAGCTPAPQGPDWGSLGAQQDPLRETKPTFPTDGPSQGRDPRHLAPTHPMRCCGLKADVCLRSCRKPAPRTPGTSVVNPLIREPRAPAWVPGAPARVPCCSYSRVLSTSTMCCLGGGPGPAAGEAAQGWSGRTQGLQRQSLWGVSFALTEGTFESPAPISRSFHEAKDQEVRV